MSIEVKVPELGENIESADVVSVLVKEGDAVTKDQALIEVESDKASLEVPSTDAGVVQEIRVAAGQKIAVGQIILILDTASSREPAGAPQAGADSPASADATPPATPASQTTPVPTPAAAPVGPSIPTTVATAPPRDPADSVPAAPSVRRLARELGIDVRRVTGSGPGGRINFDDVKLFAKNVIARRMGEPTSGAGGRAPELPDFTQWGSVRREAMTGIRRKTADKMVESWINVPHVTQFDEADITEVEVFRRAKGKLAEARGGKLTVTAILIKVTALALKRFEKFNASTDMDHDEIIYKDYVNIGVAVDTPRGLLVPVIKDADRKGVVDISIELNDLAGRARERKIKPDELQGGNLSVTNLGGLGTTYFTPIINFPDSAVLGVGRAKMQAVYDGKEFRPRMMMPLSISYDHRIIDGADAARFLRWIAEAMEQPLTLLL